MSQNIFSTHSQTQQCYVVVTGEELPATPASLESGRGLVLPTIEAYRVQHLPIVQASADKIGVVAVINPLVPTEMGIDPGPLGLGMILDTLRGRSPLYRLEAFLAHQDTPLLLGQALAPDAFHDAPVGRGLERLEAVGTMKIFTAGAGRAAQAYGLAKPYGHFATTAISV